MSWGESAMNRDDAVPAHRPARPAAAEPAGAHHPVAFDGDDPRCRCAAPTADRRGFYPPVLPALTAAEVAHRLHGKGTRPGAGHAAPGQGVEPWASVAFTDPDHPTRTLRRGLGQIQHRLVDGCLTETSLTISPTPDTNPKISQ
jgi:hypothetical protein